MLSHKVLQEHVAGRANEGLDGPCGQYIPATGTYPLYCSSVDIASSTSRQCAAMLIYHTYTIVSFINMWEVPIACKVRVHASTVRMY